MSIFTIADIHLSTGLDKPMDIFHGWDNYVDKLITNWKSIVKENDTVVIVGDISWAMKLEECEQDFKLINSLPGRKIFIKGNHDYWWGTKKKLDDFLKAHDFNTIDILFNNSYTVEGISICGSRGWFYDSGKDEDIKVLSREVGRLKLSLDSVKDDNTPIVFLHYPPIFGEYICHEIIDVLKAYGIKKCYYGHLHGSSAHRLALNGEYEGIDFRLVSSDSLKFVPLLVRN